MKRKIVVFCILGMFLLLSVSVTGEKSTTKKIVNTNIDYEELYPVMRPSPETLNEWEEEYNNAEEVYIDPDLAETIQTTTDYSILHLLDYNAEERTQGGCSNCWAWPSTAIMSIALNVQEGIFDRLSVQYINTCGELYNTFPRIGCCEGGTIGAFASFYSKTGIAIPWSNDNAHWQDHVVFRQCEIVECDDIAKYPNYPISYIRSRTLRTRNVLEEEAIDVTKNILHQDRGVSFAIFYPDETDLDNFRDFWRNENEEFIYDLDYYAGHDWVEEDIAGHAVLIVGYHDDPDTDDNDYWIILNSWGTTSGRPNGLFRVDMHMDYSLQYSEHNAFYVETLNVTFGSDAPTSQITGPSSGTTNTQYTYQISASDPQGDDVYLYVNWGDGESTYWIGPYNSEEEIEVIHSWPEQKTYTIKVKAKDIYDNVGKEIPLKISLPRNRVVNSPPSKFTKKIHYNISINPTITSTDLNKTVHNSFNSYGSKLLIINSVYP